MSKGSGSLALASLVKEYLANDGHRSKSGHNQPSLGSNQDRKAVSEFVKATAPFVRALPGVKKANITLEKVELVVPNVGKTREGEQDFNNVKFVSALKEFGVIESSHKKDKSNSSEIKITPKNKGYFNLDEVLGIESAVMSNSGLETDMNVSFAEGDYGIVNLVIKGTQNDNKDLENKINANPALKKACDTMQDKLSTQGVGLITKSTDTGVNVESKQNLKKQGEEQFVSHDSKSPPAAPPPPPRVRESEKTLPSESKATPPPPQRESRALPAVPQKSESPPAAPPPPPPRVRESEKTLPSESKATPPPPQRESRALPAVPQKSESQRGRSSSALFSGVVRSREDIAAEKARVGERVKATKVQGPMLPKLAKANKPSEAKGVFKPEPKNIKSDEQIRDNEIIGDFLDSKFKNATTHDDLANLENEFSEVELNESNSKPIEGHVEIAESTRKSPPPPPPQDKKNAVWSQEIKDKNAKAETEIKVKKKPPIAPKPPAPKASKPLSKEKVGPEKPPLSQKNANEPPAKNLGSSFASTSKLVFTSGENSVADGLAGEEKFDEWDDKTPSEYVTGEYSDTEPDLNVTTGDIRDTLSKVFLGAGDDDAKNKDEVKVGNIKDAYGSAQKTLKDLFGSGNSSKEDVGELDGKGTKNLNDIVNGLQAKLATDSPVAASSAPGRAPPPPPLPIKNDLIKEAGNGLSEAEYKQGESQSGPDSMAANDNGRASGMGIE